MSKIGIGQAWEIPLRQQLFHERHGESFPDDLRGKATHWHRDRHIVTFALDFLRGLDSGVCMLPGKIYAVAVVYAKLLAEHFPDTTLLEQLDRPDLLYGNSPGFQRYSARPAIYDAIIQGAEMWQVWTSAPGDGLRVTLECCRQEFYLDLDWTSLLEKLE